MNFIIEYNALAKKLEGQLAQRESLIKFRVLSWSEYLSKYPVSLGDISTEMLAVEWSIKIEAGLLVGTQFLSPHLITISDFDASGYILEGAADAIARHIIHPKQAEPLIPSPSD